MSDPTLDNTTTAGYFAALENMLGPDISGGKYVDPFSSNYVFTDFLGVAIDSAILLNKTETGLQYLRMLLGFPLLFFQATWASQSSPQYDDTTVVEGLPQELYISVHFSESQTHVVIPRWTVILYIVLLLTVYLWCLSCLSLSLFIRGPPTTPYESLDIASMISECRTVNASAIEVLGNLGLGSTKAYRRRLGNETFFVRKVMSTGLVSLGSEEARSTTPGTFGIVMNGESEVKPNGTSP